MITFADIKRWGLLRRGEWGGGGGGVSTEQMNAAIADSEKRNYPVGVYRDTSMESRWEIPHNTASVITVETSNEYIQLDLLTPDFNALGGKVFALDYVVYLLTPTGGVANFSLGAYTTDGDIFFGDDLPGALEGRCVYVLTFTRVPQSISEDDSGVVASDWICGVSVRRETL